MTQATVARNIFFRRMLVDVIPLITKLESNMKGASISVPDELPLRKRTIMETVNNARSLLYSKPQLRRGLAVVTAWLNAIGTSLGVNACVG